MQALIDSVPDIIFCKDLKGVYIRCNRAFEALVGTGRESILGRTDPDLFPQELADFFRDKDRRMLAAGEAVRNEEWVEFPGGRKILLETLT